MTQARKDLIAYLRELGIDFDKNKPGKDEQECCSIYISLPKEKDQKVAIITHEFAIYVKDVIHKNKQLYEGYITWDCKTDKWPDDSGYDEEPENRESIYDDGIEYGDPKYIDFIIDRYNDDNPKNPRLEIEL